MKLTANYNKVNILTSIIILVFTGIIYYFFIHLILTDKLDKDLGVEESEIRQYATTYQKLPLPASFMDQQVTYSRFDANDKEREFAYTNYYNLETKKNEPGRSLLTTVKIGNTVYRVTITKSRVEAEELVRVILLITLMVTLALLVSLLLINRFFFKRLWKPFYSILAKMRTFELSSMEGITIEPTKIDEFIELNTSVNAMADRVRKDYRELKSFTDNASHEMMTPLAVINSKLDSLLQTEGFNEQQGVLLEDIYLAIGKLSRLHQSLLLLAKIENNLISDVQELDFNALVKAKIRQFHELSVRNNLKVESRIGTIHVKMSKYLADILLNNLFSNAIRHNVSAGEICIELTTDKLIISNTGKAIDSGFRLFDRFSKSAESEGTGLGLAISKQICNLYGFGLDYTIKEKKHYFSIDFKSGQ